MPLKRRSRVAKATDIILELSHPIPIGQIVTILRIPRTSSPFIEGRAAITAVARTPDEYRVRFRGDPVIRLRKVHRDYQNDPERFLEILRDLWSVSKTQIAIEEFFPDDDLE